MRVLITEDQKQYVGYYTRDLQDNYGHTVTLVSHAEQAVAHLQNGRTDVAVVDIMLDETLWPHATSHRRSLAAALITSGLTVMAAAAELGVAIVVWTSGEANRHLHMIFAYEEFNIRAMCSKTTGEGAGELNAMIDAAHCGRTLIDPVLQPYLPPPRSPRLTQTILSDPPAQRAVWRAIALGAQSRSTVQQVTGYSRGYVGNLILDMYERLAALNLAVAPSSALADRAKFNELVRFASTNRAFFLDRAVNDLHP